MKKLITPWLLVLAALLFGGCAANTDIMTAGLRVDLVGLKQLPEGNVEVTWRIRNPNVVPYVLTESTLTLTLDGTAVGSFTDKQRFGVPAMNQADQTNLLSVSGPNAAKAVGQAAARGSANYTVHAKILLVIADDKTEKFTLSGSGTVPVSGP